MSEILTFKDYSPAKQGIDGIYAIGATEDRPGVAVEMAQAFGHELSETPDVDNLGELIGIIGPAKELQQNIGRVQDVLGTDAGAVDIARDWVERSGLLVPVDRMYKTGKAAAGDIDVAVMTDGVVNWMNRRAALVGELGTKGNIGTCIMVGGTLAVKAANDEAMTAAEYQERMLRPRVEVWDIPVETIAVDSQNGEDLAAAAADAVTKLYDAESSRIAVVGNAANWVQNGGAVLRALQKHGVKDVRVASDSMPLGDTTQKPLTHQNPYTALGQIARNLQELTRHAQ